MQPVTHNYALTLRCRPRDNPVLNRFFGDIGDGASLRGDDTEAFRLAFLMISW